MIWTEKDIVLRKRGKNKQSVTIPAAQQEGSSRWVRSTHTLCHATQPGKDTAAMGTCAESKRLAQRCVKSSDPGPQGKGEGAGTSIPTAGLLHPSHNSFPPRGSSASLLLLPTCQKRSSHQHFWTQSFCQEGSRKMKQKLVFHPPHAAIVTADEVPKAGQRLSEEVVGTTQALLFDGQQHVQEGFQLDVSCGSSPAAGRTFSGR